MKVSKLDFVENIFKGIPILKDSDFIKGDYSKIDEKTAVHYLIYPFLNILGYNVFNPEEINLNSVLDGTKADILIKDSGNNLAVFSIVDLNSPAGFKKTQTDFKEESLSNFKKFDTSIIVLTNGIEYGLYADIEGSIEEILSFSLLSLRSNDTTESGEVFDLLYKESLNKSINNSKFFTERIIKKNLGNLRNSDYLLDIVKSELKNPSDSLLDIFASSIVERYCGDLDKGIVLNSLVVEFENNPGELLSILLSSKGSQEKAPVQSTVGVEEKVENDPYTSVVYDKEEPEVKEDEKDLSSKESYVSKLGTTDNEHAEGKSLNDLLDLESDSESDSEEVSREGIALDNLLA